MTSDYLFLWDGLILFVGDGIETNSRNHHAMQIAISADKPLSMKAKNGNWNNYNSLLISPNCSNQLKADDCRIIYICVDPLTNLAKKIKLKFLDSALYNPLPMELTGKFVKDLTKLLDQQDNCKLIFNILMRLLFDLSGNESVSLGLSMDKRIIKVVNLIKQTDKKSLSLKFLSESVFLSENRLIQLFKKQVGISIRRYILWNRLNLAVEKIKNMEPLTDAAYSSGFSNPSHFNVTFLKMFGISLPELLKKNQNIQVFVCNH
jgi:AraC family transcriptional regulator, arabinose operon regulatory protein